MSLARRLVLSSSGRGGFRLPRQALVASGPYDPTFTPGATVLTELHCHTNNSDGSYTPATIVGYYAARGFDALAITDHDKHTVQPAGITTAIPGDEYSPTTQHIIGIDVATYSRSSTAAQAIVDGITTAGGQAEIAHPKWSNGISYAELQALTGHLGFEIHNAHCVTGAGQNPATYPGYAVDLWDQVLANVRRNTWGFAVDDLHKYDGFHVEDVGRVQVFAVTGGKADIMASLVDGNFVADVSNYGVTPGYPVRSNYDLSVSCTGATRVEAWGAGGVLLSASTGTDHTHTFEGSEHYVRLVAVGDYTEDFGAALDNRWVAYDGSWSVAGGVLTHTDSGATHRRMILRRHREGDFTAQVDVNMTDAGIALMFNVLNASYYYVVRLGRPPSGTGYSDTLAVAKTTNGSFNAPLASYAFAPAASTWYTIKMRYTAAPGLIEAKVWERGGAEPGAWQVSVADTAWRHGAFGLRADGEPQFDNFYADGFRTYYQPVAVD